MSLRTLLALSKKLKAKRHANGALSLASSEIRFSIDSETKDPISVQEKKMLATNSMVTITSNFIKLYACSVHVDFL